MVLMHSKAILHDAKDHYKTHPNVAVDEFEQLFVARHKRSHPYRNLGFSSMREYMKRELAVEVIAVKDKNGHLREEYAVCLCVFPWLSSYKDVRSKHVLRQCYVFKDTFQK